MAAILSAKSKWSYLRHIGFFKKQAIFGFNFIKDDFLIHSNSPYERQSWVRASGGEVCELSLSSSSLELLSMRWEKPNSHLTKGQIGYVLHPAPDSAEYHRVISNVKLDNGSHYSFLLWTTLKTLPEFWEWGMVVVFMQVPTEYSWIYISHKCILHLFWPFVTALLTSRVILNSWLYWCTIWS